MQIYNVGKDELSEWDFNQLGQDTFEWFVYEYEDGGYDGYGKAVALRKDGNLMFGNLGHCSCDGPIGMGWSEAKTGTAEEILSMTTDNIFDDVPSETVKNKVRELLGL